MQTRTIMGIRVRPTAVIDDIRCLYSENQLVDFASSVLKEHKAGSSKKLDDLNRSLNETTDRLESVYHERNQLAIALARLTLMADNVEFSDRAGYGFDPATGRGIVYVTLPSGKQVSWHMSDRITKEWQGPGRKPLPTFSGSWDGTFIGREDGWPIKYVRRPELTKVDYVELRGKSTDEILDRISGAICETKLTGDLRDKILFTAGTRNMSNKSYMRAVTVGVDREPEGATHYRVCSGGNKRYYLNDTVQWLYFHQDEQFWHPTDLDPSYLEAHLHKIADIYADDQQVTPGEGPKTIARTVAALVYESFTKTKIPTGATHLLLSADNPNSPAVAYLVMGLTTHHWVLGDNAYHWMSSAVTSGWVHRNALQIVD